MGSVSADRTVTCKGNIPGARTQIALVTTCKIAVRWKNGAAPIVVPGILVVILISPLDVFEAI